MKSLYGQYLDERQGREIIEYYDSDGIPMAFGTYEFHDRQDGKQSCYLVDVFVREDSRNLGICRRIVDDVIEIAKVIDNCDMLVTSCDVRANGVGASMSVILKCGFEPHATDGPMVYFRRGI